MEPTALPLIPDAIAAEHDAPPPERVRSGDPRFTTWNLEERDGLFAGIWQATPGAWTVVYDEWEYFRILSGRSILTGEDGTRFELRAGDSLILRPGFRGVWEVVETTRKEYVIRL